MIEKSFSLSMLCAILLLSACSSPSTNPSSTSGTPGTLHSAEELLKMTAKNNLKGKITIIDFWATWCPPCRKQIPVLIKLQDKYRKKGLNVIGISIDRPSFRLSDPKAAVEKMAKQFGINYPIGIADDKILSKFPPVQAIPTAFIFNREGVRIHTLTGFNTEAKFDKIIKELL